MTAADEPAPSTSPPLAGLVPIIGLVGLVVFYLLTATGGPASPAFLPVALAIGLVAYLLAFMDILLGLALLIACVALSPELRVGGLSNLRLEDFLLPALVLAWIPRLLRRGRVVSTGLGRPVAVYFALMIAATALGVSGGTTHPRTAVLFLGKFATYFLILFLIADNVRTERQFRALAAWLLVTGVAGIFLSLGLRGTDRLHGPSGEFANIFGGYLILNVALAVGFYLHAGSGPGRLAAAAAATFLGIALLFTYSRTSYAALAASILLFGLLRERRLLAVGVVMGTLFLLFAPDSVMRRAADIPAVVGEAPPASWRARVSSWEIAWNRTTAQNPLLGGGVGSVPLGDVDNEYFRVLADTGFLGLAAFLWILALLGRKAWRLYGALAPDTFARGFAAGYLMGFLALVVHAVGATSFSAIRPMETFMILSGLMLALAARRREWGLQDEEEEPEPLPGDAAPEPYRM